MRMPNFIITLKATTEPQSRNLPWTLGHQSTPSTWHSMRILASLSAVQEKRMAAAREFKKLVQKHSMHFLGTLITTDETWVSFSTPEIKEQSHQWLLRGSRPPVKALKAASEKKVMVILFFDSRGLVCMHYVPKGQTVNAAYFIEVLKTFLVHFCTKRHDLWTSNSWWLHMDNAHGHCQGHHGLH